MLQRAIPCVMLSAALACGLCGGELRSQDLKADSAAADGMKAWNAFYQREAENVYRFTLDAADQELVLDRTPILRWTNPLEEGDIHGVVYVWRRQGRPVVVGQLFSYLNGKGGRVYCHAMHSLVRTNAKLTGFRNEKEFWKPDAPGVEMRDVPKAPTPGATRSIRMAQTKEISRRFSAYTDEATRGKRYLRLLPAPIDRFAENTADGGDGALFALVVGNDPEVILLVETGQTQDGAPVWKYGLCRSTRSTCVGLLDDVETWRFDGDKVRPDDPRSGYLSVHGIATLLLDAPEQTATGK